MLKANLKILVAVCVSMMTLTGSAGAATYYVLPGQSIQVAINAASNGDEIEVLGTYYNEAINFNGKEVRLYSYGGPDVTTIDADGITGAYHVVQCVSGEGPNTILEGFTITGGNANGPDPNDKYGGGMLNSGSSPTVTDCNFTGNTAGTNGGGMYNTGSSPTVTDCTFSGNEAGIHGGGMANYESSPTVTNCTFSNNSATYGGGMYNYTSSPTVTNCTFSGNSADYGGGMGNWDMSSPTVTNCTFSGNTAVSGGGMGNYDNSNPTVINCILWGDTPDEIYDDLTSSTFINYSNVQDGWPGPPPPTGQYRCRPVVCRCCRR